MATGRGIAANNPLIAVTPGAPPASADLPESRSFLPFTASNLVLSTMKKAEADDSVILRAYDIEGKDTEAGLELVVPVTARGRSGRTSSRRREQP